MQTVKSQAFRHLQNIFDVVYWDRAAGAGSQKYANLMKVLDDLEMPSDSKIRICNHKLKKSVH